jgi:hypothetical protein
MGSRTWQRRDVILRRTAKARAVLACAIPSMFRPVTTTVI